MATKSRVKLTDEEQKFYRQLLVRVTNSKLGQPYIARAFFRLTPVAAPGLKTMAVDKYWRVYIDFDYFIPKGIVYAAGFLAHEPWHLLRDHEGRMTQMPKTPDDFDRHLASNIAGDLELNDDIRDLIPPDLIMPGVGTFVRAKAEQSFEFYWKWLLQNPKVVDKFSPQPKQSPQKQDKKADEKKDDGQPEKGDGKELDKGDERDGDESSENGSPSEEGKPSDSGTPSDGTGKPGGKGIPFPGKANRSADPSGEKTPNGVIEKTDAPNGDSEPTDEKSGTGSGDSDDEEDYTEHGEKQHLGCGPGAGNDDANFEDYQLGENEADGVDPTRADIIRRQVAEDIQNYMPGKGIGDAPGSIRGWASEVLAHKPVDWRAELRGAVKAAIAFQRGKLDYVRSKPSRRQHSPDFLNPGMQAPKPTIGIAIDTSGSNLHQLGLILDELGNIMKSVGVRGKEIQAFAVDVKADKVYPVNDPKKALAQSRVGGGTAMTPGYIKLGELGVDIAILFTDGLVNDFPKEKPKSKKAGTRWLTCIVTYDGEYGDRTLLKAKENLDTWGKVVPIRVESDN